jgi:sterol desaturase/sphingolipid hydroxylase (fatty acid hydroxylase superfamily)
MNLFHSILAHLPDFLRDVARLCIWLVLLAVIFLPLERFLALRGSKIKRGELFNDLAYYFLNGLLPAVLLALPMSLVAAGARQVLPPALPAAMAALPLALKLLLTLVIGEIGAYWGHRLSHQIPWLWRFHAVHHSAEHMYFLVNTRAHPVDIIVTRLFSLIPLYLLGLAGPGAGGSVAPIFLILVGTFWGFFIHSNVRLRLGPLEWLIATPGFHHWHHSRVDHINNNYAAMLPLLDRLFGTHHLPREWPSDYGIEAPLSGTLGGQLMEPLRPHR